MNFLRNMALKGLLIRLAKAGFFIEFVTSGLSQGQFNWQLNFIIPEVADITKKTL